MNVRRLECSEDVILYEYIKVASLILVDPKSRKRIVAVDVTPAGLTTALVSTGGGEIPKFGFKILDKYMLERGFLKYKWVRYLKNDVKKEVTRRIRVNS